MNTRKRSIFRYAPSYSCIKLSSS